MAYNTFGNVTFRVTSLEPLLRGIDQYSQEAVARLGELEIRFKNIARDILVEEFQNAIDQQSDFFGEYADQILQAVVQLPIGVIVTENSFEIIVNFDNLGTYQDLTEAYHYGAMLADGGQVLDFPSPGEGALKNDREKRLEFWTSVYTGQPYFHMIEDNEGNLIGAGRDISTAGMLEDTIAARVDYWSSIGKAPEWLFLQFGQPLGVPTVEASNVIQRWENRTYSLLYALFEEYLTVPRGFAISASGRPFYNVRSALGRFAKLEDRYQ